MPGPVDLSWAVSTLWNAWVGTKLGTVMQNEVLNGHEGNPASTSTAEAYVVSADGLEPSTHALKGVKKPKINELD